MGIAADSSKFFSRRAPVPMNLDPRLADSRCWVYGSSKRLPAADPIVADCLSRFMDMWQSHGMPVAGHWEVLHERFLVIVESGEGAQATGCSIDSMKAEVKRLEEILETQFLDSSRIFYRGKDGQVESVGRADFKRLAGEGLITPDTEVFDTTVLNVADLRPGVFSKPLRDSWHLQLYDRALRDRAMRPAA